MFFIVIFIQNKILTIYYYMKHLLSFPVYRFLFILVIMVNASCTKEANEITTDEEKKWSVNAPHRPQASDLKEKISGIRLGRK